MCGCMGELSAIRMNMFVFVVGKNHAAYNMRANSTLSRGATISTRDTIIILLLYFTMLYILDRII